MRNLRIPAFLAVLLVAVISSGCLRITHTLNVKRDGSGTISQVIAMSDTFMKQMGGMMAAQGGGSMLPSEEKLKAEAASWGEGVRFVNAVPYKTAGYDGITATYAFDDVTKLNFNMEQIATGAIESPMIPSEKPGKDAEIKLAFIKEGGRPVLVITMPEMPKPEAMTDEQKKQMEDASKQAENPAIEAMMKQMFAGLMMEVAIEAEGGILKTNAPFVEGSRVILVRLDGDEIVKAPGGMSAFAQMGDNPDLESMLKKVPGLKIVTQREVRIEFK